MKLMHLYLIGIVILVVMLVGCQETLSGEAAKSPKVPAVEKAAINALTKLTDAQLIILQDDTHENRPCARSGANKNVCKNVIAAEKVLGKIPERRSILISNEMKKRGLTPVRCTSTDNCNGGTEVCGMNGVGIQVCESLNSNAIGSRCVFSDECASRSCITTTDSRTGVVTGVCGRRSCSVQADCEVNEICGIDEDNVRVCEYPKPNGVRCASTEECVSSICGTNQNNEVVCEPPGQPFGNVCSVGSECASNVCDILRHICLIPTGSSCERSLDCGSFLCTIPPVDSVGRESRAVVCAVRSATPDGGDCVVDSECRSRLCGYTENNWGVCEEWGSNEAGDACRGGGECRSTRCVIGETIGGPFASLHLAYTLGYCE